MSDVQPEMSWTHRLTIVIPVLLTLAFGAWSWVVKWAGDQVVDRMDETRDTIVLQGEKIDRKMTRILDSQISLRERVVALEVQLRAHEKIHSGGSDEP